MWWVLYIIYRPVYNNYIAELLNFRQAYAGESLAFEVFPIFSCFETNSLCIQPSLLL